MPTIFISYRREDSAGHAGRLFDRLRERFGKDRVFLDVVGIDAGVDFVDTIDQAVGSCDVLLAVIGREWLTCCDKQNRRRLDDPNDFIRAEITSALKRNVRVVPVLVEGAEMPPTDALPDDLKRLTRRQAVELRDSRWDADVEALISALERDAAPTGVGLPKPAPPPVRSGPVEPEAGRKKTLLWGIAAVALLIVAGVAVSVWQPWKQQPSNGGSQGVGPMATPKPEETTAAPPLVDSSPEPVSETPATPKPEETPEATPRDDRPPEPEVRMVKAPDLAGLSLQAASNRLREAGLAVGEREGRQTAEAPAGQVLSQWPRPGKELDKGSRVDLVYAEPLPDSRIPVPDLVGTDVRNAKDVLQNAGLELAARKQVPSKEAKYTVLRQEPAAGKQVEKGTQVTLFYAIEDRPPDTVARTIVHIWYNDEAERPTVADLATFLRGHFPEADLRIRLDKSARLKAGKVHYASRDDQAKLASAIASRSGEFLSKATGREVLIQTALDPKIAKNSLILTMPKL